MTMEAALEADRPNATPLGEGRLVLLPLLLSSPRWWLEAAEWGRSESALEACLRAGRGEVGLGQLW
jgi:hypothetical protein